MNKLILFRNPNNGDRQSVISCAEVEVDNVLARAIPEGASNLRVMDAIDLDRTFRDAWEDDGVTVKVNMPQARLIHLDRLRDKRVAILGKLDVEWSRAVAQKNQILADSIETKRQALRDMPQTVKPSLDAANTPDELKLVMPNSLKTL